MLLQDLVNYVNDKLAGERYTYDQIRRTMDMVIDEINAKLCSKFPVFSELPVNTVEYTAFPDKYLRSVVVTGTTAKLFAIDEEGQLVAPVFDKEYANNLFIMLRDYGPNVPEAYLDLEQGFYNGGSTYYGLPPYGTLLDGGSDVE